VIGPTDSEPPFDDWLTPEAAEDVKGLRGAHAREVKKARAELERIGCGAAHYRLSGADVEHLCVLKLRDNFRMVLLFPATAATYISVSRDEMCIVSFRDVRHRDSRGSR
jgi:hypothetical protein